MSVMAFLKSVRYLLNILVWTLFLSDSIRTVFALQTSESVVESIKPYMKKGSKSMFVNKWVVMVHSDEQMAAQVAKDNGFINLGKVKYVTLHFHLI